VVQAWGSGICTNGRYNQGSSHPADVITEIRMLTASGENLPITNGYSYIRLASGAYAYSGCPVPDDDYELGGYHNYERSENANTEGCMYRFSSVYSGTTFNICCSGGHNPHQTKFGKSGTLEPRGRWDIRYSGSSVNGGWNGPYTSQFAAGYGERYSDPTGNGNNFTVVNGRTTYHRAYWRVDPATTLTTEISPPEAKTAGAVITSTSGAINCGATCSASFADNSIQNIQATPTITTASGTYTFSRWDFYQNGSGTVTVQYFDPAIMPVNMLWTWRAVAVYTLIPPTVCDIALSVSPSSVNDEGSFTATWKPNDKTTAITGSTGFVPSLIGASPLNGGTQLITTPHASVSYTYNLSVTGRNSVGTPCTNTATVAVVVPSTLTCSYTPLGGGPSPLVVKAYVGTESGTLTSPYIVNWGDGTSNSYATKPTSVNPAYHTYFATVNTPYTITINDSSVPVLTDTCTPDLTVKPTSGSGGGEVAP
jgi:hypothetical protein